MDGGFTKQTIPLILVVKSSESSFRYIWRKTTISLTYITDAKDKCSLTKPNLITEITLKQKL